MKQNVRKLLPAIASICDAGVVLCDAKGRCLASVDAKGVEVPLNSERLAELSRFTAPDSPGISASLFEDGSGVLFLSFAGYRVFIDSRPRFLAELLLFQQFKSALPRISAVVGGDADLFNEQGIRIVSCHHDGKPFVREKPYSDQTQLAMQERRPVIGTSNTVKGGMAARFPVSRHYGLGFNNERAILQREKLLDRTRHFQYARYTFKDIVGTSNAISECVTLARRVAANLSTVLLMGETGTGKELFAHSIHNESARCNHPFVALNCAALPASLADSILFGYEGGSFTGAKKDGDVGIFEQANGGTVFLDEISEMSLDLQTKLLRVLQEKEVVRVGGRKKISIDVRIISASNKSLETLLEKNEFRQDLYYRLHVVEIVIPPLRRRTEDIPALIDSFLFTLNRLIGTSVAGVSRDALDILRNYHWPGNIRELYNCIERGLNLVTGENERILQVEHLPPLIVRQSGHPADFQSGAASTQEGGMLYMAVGRTERDIIDRLLKQTGDNREEVARMLGISTATLWRKMKRHNFLNLPLENEEETIRDALRETGGSRVQTARKLNVTTTTLWRKMKKYGMS
jgi:transcriptional regulator with PAS, ATPase and Fis domain